MTLAFLAASLVNLALVLSERARSGLLETTSPVLTRFADLAVELETSPNPPRLRTLGRERLGLPAPMARIRIGAEARIPIDASNRSPRLETRLVRALNEAGATSTDVRVATRVIPYRDRFLPGRREQESSRPPLSDRRLREIQLAVRLTDGRWLNADVAVPMPPRQYGERDILSVLFLFGAMLAAALWMAGRLARPLKDLSAAAERVGSAAGAPLVPVRGPSDVRRTIEAFNAMNGRVSDLLTEKDVMLGAIGHDLRTPLTSLRIRLESMEPETDREKAIKTVEETAALLETILDLARLGKSSEPLQLIDLGGLLTSEAAGYLERGVALPISIEGQVKTIGQPLLFRRMLRNLIENGLHHGGGAEVTLRKEGGSATIEIADRGPGMSPETMAAALRPFVRGEGSRNRSSGGAGLGLALADAIVKAHGGDLSLANRQPSGLLVTVRLPAAP